MSLIATTTLLFLGVVHFLGTRCYRNWHPLTSVALVVGLSLPLLAGFGH